MKMDAIASDHRQKDEMLSVELTPTPSQEKFIHFRKGAAILHAPVGTGKTFALAERAAYGIQQGVAPPEVLCVTFTNLAAREMRERVVQRCGREAGAVVVRTFHALAAWILRLEAKALGLPADFAVYDEWDSYEILAEVMGPRADARQVREVYGSLQQAKVTPGPGHRLPVDYESVFAHVPAHWQRAAHAYQRRLQAYHALDFADLITWCVAALTTDGPVRDRWQRRFAMVQVDEMQDTHMAEYLIVRELARNAASVVLAGDFDQTIYEWRGSVPRPVLDRFREDFAPVTHFAFTDNHRATRTLLTVTHAVLDGMGSDGGHRPVPASRLEEGEPVRCHVAENAQQEAAWIARDIERVRDQWRRRYGKELPYRRIGVLGRAHYRGRDVSEALERAGIPHGTVETFQFFRRQEVKDVLAHLRFLVNPYDGPAFHRMLLRPARGVGPATLKRLRQAAGAGLRLADLGRMSTVETGDPFGPLLDAWESGSIVIVDTETTGLDLSRSEVVELAGVRLERGRAVDTFRRFIRPSHDVGESEAVHGWSDALLREQGEDAATVFRDWDQFVGDALVVGHNVGFDLRMLRSHGGRVGVPLPVAWGADTLDLARRFLPGVQEFSLAYLADRLGIPVGRAHHALDDARATAELLARLMPKVAQGAADRREAVAAVKETLAPFVREIASWRALMDELAPAELLDHVLERSGLGAYYEERRDREPRRWENLQELRFIAAQWEARQRGGEDGAALGGGGMASVSALEGFLHYASLAASADRFGEDDDRVRVLTVHHSKGMEFDVVYVAGLAEGEFPSYRSLAAGLEKEEWRVFYVAVTRAKRLLVLTGHRWDGRRQRQPSRFFRAIPRHLQARPDEG